MNRYYIKLKLRQGRLPRKKREIILSINSPGGEVTSASKLARIVNLVEALIEISIVCNTATVALRNSAIAFNAAMTMLNTLNRTNKTEA